MLACHMNLWFLTMCSLLWKIRSDFFTLNFPLSNIHHIFHSIAQPTGNTRFYHRILIHYPASANYFRAAISRTSAIWVWFQHVTYVMFHEAAPLTEDLSLASEASSPDFGYIPTAWLVWIRHDSFIYSVKIATISYLHLIHMVPACLLYTSRCV